MIDVDIAKRVPGFTLEVSFRSGNGITALFGPSGSGKSMTLALIAGLLRPDRGRITIGETALVDMPRMCMPTHRRRVGLVFQDSHLFPHLSVRQNLLFGRWFAPRAAPDIGFDAVIETLGIGPLLARRPATLSGGERQRVAIGRAVLARPRVLLLDEPLAALDRPRKLEILPLIEGLRDAFDLPIVYVSHAVEEVVRLAAHIVVLEQGRVTGQGRATEVFRPPRRPDEPRFGRFAAIDVTVGAFDAEFELTELKHPAGTLWLATHAMAPGRTVRALIYATDVSLALGQTGPTSIRSALAGTVAAIESHGPLAAVDVALNGGGALVALITRRSLFELGIDIGTPVNALIKTVALDEGTVAAS
jgi:molybdate transport system ATP-binding protein